MNNLSDGLFSKVGSAAISLQQSVPGRWVAGAIFAWFYISSEFARSYTILSARHSQSQRCKG